MQEDKTIDLSTLSGWNNLSPGNHLIKIKVQGSGYLDSNLSSPVTITKNSSSSTALEQATWEEIDAACTDGTAITKYSVGDEKTITLTTGEEVTLQILGFNHDDLADGSGKASITFGMKNLLTTTYQMNSTDTNVGGWGSSLMRTSTMATLFTQLPSDLQSVIKEVSKKTTAGNKSVSIKITTDKLFLFSEVELDATTLEGYVDEGEQYEYWQSHNTLADRVKRISNGAGDLGYWWLRSPYLKNPLPFRNVAITGGINFSLATTLYNICFGFCVGKHPLSSWSVGITLSVYSGYEGSGTISVYDGTSTAGTLLISKDTTDSSFNETVTCTSGSLFIIETNATAYDGSIDSTSTTGGVTYVDSENITSGITLTVMGDGTFSARTFVCLTGDTLITLADGTEKRIDELSYEDKVLGYNPETKALVAQKVLYTDSKENKSYKEYDKWYLSDDSVIKTVHRHRFYNVERQAFVYMDEWNIGEHFKRLDGSTPSLVSHEKIVEKVKHYTLFTEYQNYFANGCLSGNRWSTYKE